MKPSIPTIQQVIDKAKKYREMGLSQEDAIKQMMKDIKSLVVDAQRNKDM